MRLKAVESFCPDTKVDSSTAAESRKDHLIANVHVDEWKSILLSSVNFEERVRRRCLFTITTMSSNELSFIPLFHYTG